MIPFVHGERKQRAKKQAFIGITNGSPSLPPMKLKQYQDLTCGTHVPVGPRLIRLAHDLNGHLGTKKVKQLLQQRVCWPGLHVDVTEWCTNCESCQYQRKTQGHQGSNGAYSDYDNAIREGGHRFGWPLPQDKGWLQIPPHHHGSGHPIPRGTPSQDSDC